MSLIKPSPNMLALRRFIRRAGHASDSFRRGRITSFEQRWRAGAAFNAQRGLLTEALHGGGCRLRAGYRHEGRATKASAEIRGGEET